MATAKIAKGLPTPIATSLGRMISRYAYLEWRMAKTMYALCGVGMKIGRIAVNAPKLQEYPARMQDVALVVGLDLSPFPWAPFRKMLEDVKEDRDLYAHSIWLKHKDRGVYMIQNSRGKWQPDPKNPSVSRRITPQGIKVTSQDLILVRRSIEKAIAEAESLARFVSLSLQTYGRK